MYMPKKDDRYYRTSGMYLAAFLFANGIELAGIDRNDPNRAKFVFVDDPQREALVHAFNFGPENSTSVLLDARKMITAIRNMKQVLRQGCEADDRI